MQTHFTFLHYINQQEDEKPSSLLAPAPRVWLSRAEPAQVAPVLEGAPLHCPLPQAETPVREDTPPECWDMAKHFYRTVLLEVQLKKNEGSWWIRNQPRLPHKEGFRIQRHLTNMLTNSLD